MARSARRSWRAGATLARGRRSPRPSASPPRLAPRYVYRPPAPPLPTPCPGRRARDGPALTRHRVLGGPRGLFHRPTRPRCSRASVPTKMATTTMKTRRRTSWTPTTPRPGLLSETDLPPGRYDLAVSAPGMRTTRIEEACPRATRSSRSRRARARAAGRARRAQLRRAPRSSCASPQGPERRRVGRRQAGCRDLPVRLRKSARAGPLTVVPTQGAEVGGALVTLPTTGDVAQFVCLAPPCAGAPASLAVFVADVAGHPIDDALLEWSTLRRHRGELGSDSVRRP